jgi:hypothetical protein
LLHLCSGGVSAQRSDRRHAPKEPKGPTDKNGDAMIIKIRAAAATAAAESVAAAELALGMAVQVNSKQ